MFPVLNENAQIHETIMTLRHLIMLHTVKLTVMIVSGLLQVSASPWNNPTALTAKIVSVLVASYITTLHFSSYRHYVRNGSAERRPMKQYKLLYLGLVSVVLLSGFSPQSDMQSAPWFHLTYLTVFMIVIPFSMFLLTTIAVSAVVIWYLLVLSCHYDYLKGFDEDRCIYWVISCVFGFFVCELESRRIARSLRWSDMKQSHSWVRGGCLTNCWLHCWCSGCVSE